MTTADEPMKRKWTWEPTIDPEHLERRFTILADGKDMASTDTADVAQFMVEALTLREELEAVKRLLAGLTAAEKMIAMSMAFQLVAVERSGR